MVEFVEFYGRSYPARLTGDDVGVFLPQLAMDRLAVTSTQQAAPLWRRSDGSD